MAIQFYTNIDLSKNQLQNATFHILPSAPSNPVEGLFYYNSTDKKLYYYDGTKWVDAASMNLPDASTTQKGIVQLVNDLTSESNTMALTAAQGKNLKNLIDAISNALGTASSKDVGVAAGNVPILDSNGKLQTSTIPDLAITDVTTCSSEADMLALNAQQGDVCVRTDINKIFMLKQEPASNIDNWIALEISIQVLSVNGKTGTVVIGAEDINDIALAWNMLGWEENSDDNNIDQAFDKIVELIKTLYITSKSGSILVGNGVDTSITIKHGFASKDVIVEIYEVSTGQTVYTDVTRINANNIRLDFAEPPATNQFKVLIRKNTGFDSIEVV